MIHVVHMIQRRLSGRPLPHALPWVLASAAVLLLGLGLWLAQ